MGEGAPAWQGEVCHSDGVLVVANKLKAGETSTTHAHQYSQFTILAEGSAEITVSGEKQKLTAPACTEIKAGIEHQIAAITDSTWYCVHATTGAVDPKVMDLICQAESA